MSSLTKDLPPLPPDPSLEDSHKHHPGVFRRLTSRLRSPSQTWVHVPPSHNVPHDLECVDEAPSASPKKEKSKRKGSTHLLSLPGPPTAHRKAGVELENAFTSAEQRQAALRAVGLVPANARPGRDVQGYKVPLSEQEAQLDKLYATAPGAASGSVGEQESEAQKIKDAWMKKNSEAGGGSDAGSSTRSASRSPELTRRSPEPKWEPAAVVEEPKAIEKPLMTTDQVRARRKDDPVFAPSGLLAAMQAYRPENYRPPPGRKPSGVPAALQRRGGPDSDTDSDS